MHYPTPVFTDYRLNNKMAEDEVLFDDVYELGEVIGK